MKGVAFIPALLALATAVSGQTITKVTPDVTPAISPNDKIEWVDLDGDHDADLIVKYQDPYSFSQSYLRFYKNDAGVLSLQASAVDGAITDPGSYDFGDYDADGDLDIIMVDYQAVKILVNQGNFSFTIITTSITENTYNPAVFWEDLDGDLDLDIVFSDKFFINRQGQYSLSLYKMPLFSSAQSWADMNGDGLMDMLATQGQTAYVNPLYLFLNEGNGKFTPAQLLMEGYSDFSFPLLHDFDLDGDLDIVVPDYNGHVYIIKNLFKESGTVSFGKSELITGLNNARGVSADLNHDGLCDLIINGYEYPNRKTYLFLNTSSAAGISFSKSSFPLEMYSTTSFNLVDFDSNGELELYANGWEDTYSKFLSQLVKIHFEGTEPLPAVPAGLTSEIKEQVVLSWTPGTGGDITYSINLKKDGSPYNPASSTPDGQLLHIGVTNFPNEAKTQLHGLPAGNYEWRVQAISASFIGSAFSAPQSFVVLAAPTGLTLTALSYSQVRLDWAIAGPADSFAIFRSSDSYALEQVATVPGTQFSYTDSDIPANEHFEYYVRAIAGDSYSASSNVVTHYSAQFTTIEFGRDQPNIITVNGTSADFDNDGDYDLGFTGRINLNSIPSVRLTNNGLGNFTASSFLPPTEYSFDYMPFIQSRDMDNDGDIDVIVRAGSDYSWQKILILRNDNGNFTKVFETEQLLGIWQIETADFNRDGRIDLLYSHTIGNSTGNPIQQRLLVQQSDGSFEQSPFRFFPERDENPGSFTLADINDDHYTDVLFSGGQYKKPALFINHGGMTFTLTPFESEALGSFVFADFNGDGKVDLMKEGEGYSLLLYEGNGTLSFTNPKESRIGLSLSGGGYLSWNIADIDMDGLPDILLTNSYRTYVVYNKGNFNFVLAQYVFPANDYTSAFLTDLENDGDLDIVKLGNDYYHQGLNYFFRNESGALNAAPAAPTGITYTQTGEEIVFEWYPATDDRTPAGFLSYNVEIKNQNGSYAVHPETNTDGTFRKRLGPGNAGFHPRFKINQLPAGSYSVRVQALDASFKLSTWSAVLPLTILPGPTNLAIERMELGKVKLSWVNSSTPEDQVIVERKSVDSEFEIIAELGPGSANVIDDHLVYNKLYTYRVFEKAGDVHTASSDLAEWNTSLFQTAETTLTNVNGSLDVGDFNADGRMDLLITGGRIYSGETKDITKAIFKNTAAGWIKQPVGSTEISHLGSLTFVDLNKDHLPDLWEYGYDFNAGVQKTEVFSNAGNETFTPVQNALTAEGYPLIAESDINGDNDRDYFSTGTYFQNVNGTLTEFSSPLPQCTGSCYWEVEPVDVDNDGDDDLFRHNYSESKYELWMNEKGVYQKTDVSISSYSASVQVVDYNGDRFPDLLFMTDYYSYYYEATNLYKNLGPDENGKAHFQKINLDLSSGDINPVCSDFDLDGDMDIFLPASPCRLYLNEGNDSFSIYRIPGLFASLNNCKPVDFDNDGDLDIYLSGYIQKGDLAGYDVPHSFVLYNQMINNGTGIANAAPAAPTNLHMLQDTSGVHLYWDVPADDHTPAEALTFDIAIDDGQTEYLRGPVDPTTGIRYKLRQGTSASKGLLTGLPVGNYTWKVQAIDQSFYGSAFSIPATMTVLAPPPSGISDTMIYRCGRLVSLVADGQNIEWYSDAALSTKVADGVFHPETSQVVYVTQTINGLRGIARPVTITIYDRPDKPVISGAYTVVCEAYIGFPTYLLAAGENIRWYNDPQLTDLETTGNYVSLTISKKALYATQTIEGCESLGQDYQFDIVEINSSLNYDQGTLTAAEVNADSYQWYIDGSAIPGATSQSIETTDVGIYTVCIYKRVCSETSEPYLITEIARIHSGIAVYPNPARDQFLITLPGGGADIQIYDVHGQPAFHTQTTGEAVIVPSKGWISGVYFMTVTQGTTQAIRKVVIL